MLRQTVNAGILAIVKHYLFRCILISRFSYVENSLHFNLADFYYQNSYHIVYILQRILHITSHNC